MRTTDWVEAGARVLVETRYNIKSETVERVTKTQIILTNGARYRRADGYPVGRSGSWNAERIQNPDDPAVHERYRRWRAERARATTTYRVETLMSYWKKTGEASHAREAVELITAALAAESSS